MDTNYAGAPIMNAKQNILKVLRQNPEVVSGATLSAMCGISRVAVWKHIQRLQALGYSIRPASNGYQLLGSPDIPYPWEIPGWESRLLYYPESPSTMDIAKDLARSGCPEYTVVVAGCQTSGRGRLSRKWVSEDGGLYFTMVLRPRLPTPWSCRPAFLASVTLARTVRELYGIACGVKWPNDILVDGRKLAGMLCEIEAEAERIAFLNIGIGINVNNDPSGIEPKATSITAISGTAVSRNELLARFLEAFERRMQTGDLEHVIPEWKEHSVTLNRPVKIVTHVEEARGLAVDVDNNGGLILKLADGSLKTVLYGDCFHQDAR
jgi:BirA family biotin operon repressor/biotin-[acetyl-CoA-carboxylase] ligase